MLAPQQAIDESAVAFKVQLVGIFPETSQRNGLFTVASHVLIGEVKKTDLIIIPAIHGDPHTVLHNNAAFVPWIIRQYKAGAEVASLCIASFFLLAAHARSSAFRAIVAACVARETGLDNSQ